MTIKQIIDEVYRGKNRSDLDAWIRSYEDFWAFSQAYTGKEGAVRIIENAAWSMRDAIEVLKRLRFIEQGILKVEEA